MALNSLRFCLSVKLFISPLNLNEQEAPMNAMRPWVPPRYSCEGDHSDDEKAKSLSHVWLFATPWTVAHQVPPSIGFFRQEYWNGLLFPSPGDLPNPGIEPRSPALRADVLTSEPPGKCLVLWFKINKTQTLISKSLKTNREDRRVDKYAIKGMLILS